MVVCGISMDRFSSSLARDDRLIRVGVWPEMIDSSGLVSGQR